jgi:succinate-semialdehyde dehydrogenase/glutarate-semialdehyde dehydrogenase
MKFESRNPFSDEHILTHEYDTREEIMSKIIEAKNAYIVWNKLTIEERATHIFKFAVKLEEQREVVAQMITLETAKPINQSYAEIDKCIITIKYFVDHAKDFLANTIINEHAHLQYDSLGVLFGIMPWNFPLWQALRFAIPSLLAGNVVLVKPAPNTATCSLFIEKIFVLTGIDLPIYTQIYSKIEDIEFIISNEYIQGVSLTGSTEAGRSVAQICAKYFKKYVLELGGNDPFIVLEDADIQQAVHMAIESRVRNNGQSCIAAKRFIIHENSFAHTQIR